MPTPFHAYRDDFRKLPRMRTTESMSRLLVAVPAKMLADLKSTALREEKTIAGLVREAINAAYGNGKTP